MTDRAFAGTLRSMKKILVVPLVVALILTLFAWPAARVGPRELPLGVVGPVPPLPQDKLDAPRFAPERPAREAIEAREVSGAIVPGPKLLAATAASPAVAQLLPHAAPQAPVEDVVEAKPASAGLPAAVLP